jgi:lipopolysaccharide biosynthesis protein
LEFTEPGLVHDISVYRRPNLGYDFGSWASFLHAFPEAAVSPRVILANDSLVGPFETVSPMLHDFDLCPTDIWGITGTTQDAAHLQSHFIGYRDGVLREPVLRRFWSDIRVEQDKRQLILRYEIGMCQLAFAEGYVLAAHYPWDWATALGQTPTSAGWRRLILRGFPFVKRELLLRPPPEVPDADDIPRVVRERWGENVQEWL